MSSWGSWPRVRWGARPGQLAAGWGAAPHTPEVRSALAQRTARELCRGRRGGAVCDCDMLDTNNTLAGTLLKCVSITNELNHGPWGRSGHLPLYQGLRERMQAVPASRAPGGAGPGERREESPRRGGGGTGVAATRC